MPGARGARRRRPLPAAGPGRAARRGDRRRAADVGAPATCRWPASRWRSTGRSGTSSTGSAPGPRTRRYTLPRPAGEKRVLYLSSPIGLGSRPPRPRGRRGAAPAAARRPGRLAGPAAADRLAATARRDGPPGVGVPGQRGGAHRRARRRARPARVPGDPRDGRDPGRQLHGLQRDRRAGALRPLGRRRGLGARPLPAREPRAQADGLRVADRLRRLAADDRRTATGRPR